MGHHEAIPIISWVFGGIATVIVGARLYTRGCLTHWMGWDDAFIVFALVSTPREVPFTLLTR